MKFALVAILGICWSCVLAGPTAVRAPLLPAAQHIALDPEAVVIQSHLPTVAPTQPAPVAVPSARLYRTSNLLKQAAPGQLKAATRHKQTTDGLSWVFLAILLCGISALAGAVGGSIMLAAGVAGFGANTAIFSSLSTAFFTYILFLMGFMSGMGGDESLRWEHVAFMLPAVATASYTWLGLLRVGFFATFPGYIVALSISAAILLTLVALAIFVH